MDPAAPQIHRIERIRREPKRRRLTVADAHWVTPKMRRIVLASPELADFASAAPDDHVKLFVPDPGSPGGVAKRDYTPRAFDAAAATLTIDFAVHQAGPATAWALGARPGDPLEIGGPRGSQVVADDFDWVLLVGDETALPATGRRVEGLRPGVPVMTIVVIDDADEIQTFATQADWRPLWVERSGRGRGDAALLRQALDGWAAPPGDGYVWIAAEAQAARALKVHMLEDRGHPKAWLKAAGYWVRGKAGESEKMEG